MGASEETVAVADSVAPAKLATVVALQPSTEVMMLSFILRHPPSFVLAKTPEKGQEVTVTKNG